MVHPVLSSGKIIGAAKILKCIQMAHMRAKIFYIKFPTLPALLDEIVLEIQSESIAFKNLKPTVEMTQQISKLKS